MRQTEHALPAPGEGRGRDRDALAAGQVPCGRGGGLEACGGRGLRTGRGPADVPADRRRHAPVVPQRGPLPGLRGRPHGGRQQSRAREVRVLAPEAQPEIRACGRAGAEGGEGRCPGCCGQAFALLHLADAALELRGRHAQVPPRAGRRGHLRLRRLGSLQQREREAEAGRILGQRRLLRRHEGHAGGQDRGGVPHSPEHPGLPPLLAACH
mmetsp:Transcript_135712/g.378071  ORF Transcript_135712/g.378071 Transcript_135712/m.378071 type:complete len:211 (+) Transcript_135712:553-1185(+)